MNKGTLNCQESFMLALQTGLHKDLGTFHQIPPREIERDLDYVRSRVKAEGLSFLTKTLPLLTKRLDQALKSGNFQCPSNFKTWKNTNLPCFMHRFFEMVFDQNGQLKVNADIAVVRDIRQVGYLFYKYQLPYHDRLVAKTVKEFIDDDKQLSIDFSDMAVQSTLYYAQEVINAVFNDFEHSQVRPKNGPGSVANGLKPWQRYSPSRFYKSLDEIIPYYRMYFCSDNHLFDRWNEWFELEFGDPMVMARLIAVPKDSRGPRLISSEQSEFMTYQQCLRREIVPYIEAHPLSGGQVNFTDQSINGVLALQASKTRELATLDLSKASDLLSLELVDALFESTSIHKFLMNSRSVGTSTPEGDLIFRKFAPMGSALCFPVQSITFYALLVGRMVANGEKLGVAARKVYVYGDDIIVPTTFVPEAIECLESVGLKVNTSKSCYTGDFRESCGVDAFRGVDITPIKLKKVWNTKPDASATVAWLDMCNSFFLHGYWITSDIIRRKIDNVSKGLPFPLRTIDSPVLGYTTWSHDHVIQSNKRRLKWDHSLQCWTIRAKCLRGSPRAELRDGWKRILRYGWEKDPVKVLPLTGNFPILYDEDPFATDAFVARNTTKIKYSVVTEAAM